MKIIKYISFIALAAAFCSCEQFMEPPKDSYLRDYQVFDSRENFRGLLYNTFGALPLRMNFVFEAATDNAVANIDNHVASRSARGGISYISNPLDQIGQNGYDGSIWGYNFSHINRVNYFLKHLWYDPEKNPPTPVIFEFDEQMNRAWYYQLLGEAYFMRAWFQFDLLQKYGGLGPDGIVYGFPIVTEYITVGDELDLRRDTYEDCVKRIVADCDTAFKYLAFVYDRADLPMWEGGVFGSGRPSGAAALALKTRTLLYAASPAYNIDNDVAKWRLAAEAAEKAIIDLGGLILLDTYDNYFAVSNLNDNNYTNPDMLFRGPIQRTVRTYETENYPPRASGEGRFNPTQNLVDAFPMSDGYPIGKSPNFAYDANDMYANRDPRLEQFIMYHGHPLEDWGWLANPNTIETFPGGNDAFGTHQNATRTGYYLRKHLRPGVRLTGNIVSTNHAPVLLGRAELYLNFAEAVFHATGSATNNRYTWTAQQALMRVRTRALDLGGVALALDPYMQSVASNNVEFLALLRNERRIELCFEGHRFWDLRRWSAGVNDMEAINAPVYGIYSDNPVEIRQFRSPYMPLPYSEMLKTRNLVNNVGWQ